MGASQWNNKKILGEERWSRTYEVEPGIPVSVSKFVTDNIAITADAVETEWLSWSTSDRIAFAHAFSQKPQFSWEDEKILDFLMSVDDERVLCSIANGLPRHSKKRRVLDFLVHKLRTGSEPKANYVQALGTLGASEAIPALKELHDHLARQINDADPAEDKALIFDFVVCCSSLAKLQPSSGYRDEIKPFLGHPNRHVQAFSRLYFDGGPPARQN